MANELFHTRAADPEEYPIVDLSPEGRLDLRFPAGIVIRGLRAGADLDTGRALAVRLERRGESAFEGFAQGGRLAVSLDLAPGADSLGIELRVRNLGPAPVRVERLLPLVLDAREGGALRSGEGACALARPAASARALRVGYANAIPPVPLGPRDREDRATSHPLLLRAMPRALARMGFDADALPASIPGRVTSAWFTVLRPEREGPALAIGFTGFREQLGRVRVGLGRAAGAHLAAEAPADGAVLAPGAEIRAERLFLAAAALPHDALARYARETALRTGSRPRSFRYWCTWYAAPCDRIDERFVASSAAALARRGAPVDFVLVDDGWQRALGDWTETNARFPRGLAALAATIREAGFGPGIWLAPFAVSRRSRLFREHPDWVLRDPAGDPLVAGVIAGLGAPPRAYHALDLRREDVLAHLEETAHTLTRAGFALLKLDFLTAGALAPPRARAYAAGMAALRRGAGPALFLGAIAPFAANAGHVEAQRVGADVAFGRPRFLTPLARLLGDWTSPAVRNALPGPLALAALDGRLFANDADCVVARGLPPRLARALARASLLTAGVTAIGDDPRRGPGDALDLVRALLPLKREETIVIDLLERTIPERLLIRPRGGEPFRVDFRWPGNS